MLQSQTSKTHEIARMINEMKQDPTKLSILEFEDPDDPTNLRNTEIKEIVVHCVTEEDD